MPGGPQLPDHPLPARWGAGRRGPPRQRGLSRRPGSSGHDHGGDLQPGGAVFPGPGGAPGCRAGGGGGGPGKDAGHPGSGGRLSTDPGDGAQRRAGRRRRSHAVCPPLRQPDRSRCLRVHAPGGHGRANGSLRQHVARLRLGGRGLLGPGHPGARQAAQRHRLSGLQRRPAGRPFAGRV